MNGSIQCRAAHGAFVMAAALALPLAMQASHAATRVELGDADIAGLVDVQFHASSAIASASDRHARALGLDPGLRLEQLDVSVDAAGTRFHRYRQSFRGIPVWGGQVVVGEDSGGRIVHLSGRLVTNIAPDLQRADAVVVPRASALGIARDAATRLDAAPASRGEMELAIYLDEDDRASLAYVASFPADALHGGDRARSYVAVDAVRGRVIGQWSAPASELAGRAGILPGSPVPGACGTGCRHEDATAVTAADKPPVADFQVSTSALTAYFADTSTDSDGKVVRRLWRFGDGSTSSARTPVHAYRAAGTYTISERVWDDAGGNASRTATVAVAATGGATTLEPGGYWPITAVAGASVNFVFDNYGVPSWELYGGGGSGNADLYVKLGSPPTDTDYDCRPYLSGRASEACYFGFVQGRYYIRVRARSAISGYQLITSESVP